MTKKEMDVLRSSTLNDKEILKVKYVGKSNGNFDNGQILEAIPNMKKFSKLPYPQPKWIACNYRVLDKDGELFVVAEEKFGKLKNNFIWIKEREEQ